MKLTKLKLFFKVIILTFFTLGVTLILCESFFVLNTKYNWIESKVFEFGELVEDSPNLDPRLKERKTKYLSAYSEFYRHHNNLTLDYTHKLPPGTSPKQIKFVNGNSTVKFNGFDQNLYEVKLNFVNEKTEGMSYRATFNNGKSPAQFLIHIGDSFIFGEGVESEETLPSQLSKILPEYKSYNFGIFATDPNDHLFNIQNNIDKRFSDVKEITGDVIYYHLPFHILRAICTLECYLKNNNYLLEKPLYGFENNVLLLKSRDQRIKYIPDFILNLIANSETMKFAGFQILSEHSIHDYETYLAIINELFFEISKKVKLRNKIIVIDPDTTRQQADILIQLSAKYDMKIINLGYRRWNKKYQETIDWLLPLDSHPTPERNHYMAQLLAPYFK